MAYCTGGNQQPAEKAAKRENISAVSYNSFNCMSRNLYLFFACALAPAFAQPVHLKIDTTQVVREIDPKIYGQFLEHIYHSVNGGVWGEVVWNAASRSA